MSSSYAFSNPEGMYFVTFSTVEWVDTLSRRIYKDIIVDSMNYCIHEKGLRYTRLGNYDQSCSYDHFKRWAIFIWGNKVEKDGYFGYLNQLEKKIKEH